MCACVCACAYIGSLIIDINSPDKYRFATGSWQVHDRYVWLRWYKRNHLFGLNSCLSKCVLHDRRFTSAEKMVFSDYAKQRILSLYWKGLTGVFIRRNGTMEWNGMEWNGTVEWNDHAHMCTRNSCRCV